MIITSGSPSPESIAMLQVLRDAVAEALEKKRRLGQYAVIWQDDRPVFIGDETPSRELDNDNPAYTVNW
jgi:hypothetical protein